MADLIKVVAVDPERVGFWEQHPEHPEGEAFVAGTQAVEIAETPAALKALTEKRIRKASERSAPAKK